MNVQVTKSPAPMWMFTLAAFDSSTEPPVEQLRPVSVQPACAASTTLNSPGLTSNCFESLAPAAGESWNGVDPSAPCWVSVKPNVPAPPRVCLTISIVPWRTLVNVHVTWSPYVSELRSRLVRRRLPRSSS